MGVRNDPGEGARECASRSTAVFLRRGRSLAVARRDAEAWVLGNYGIEVSLAEEQAANVRPRHIPKAWASNSATTSNATRLENLYHAYRGAKTWSW